MRLVSWLVFVALTCASSLALAQPGPPPPSDAELRQATTPDVLRQTAEQLDRLRGEIASAASPMQRVELLHRRWDVALGLANSVSQARSRPTTQPDVRALAHFEQLVGHPAHDAAWALQACLHGVAESHVLGRAARGCLASQPAPYYLQQAGWSRAFTEGDAAETSVIYDRTAACAERGEARCRVALSAMRIEVRDYAGAISAVRGLPDAGARTNAAIATFLSGDQEAGFALVAAVLADHPDAVEAAFAYADFTHLYVPQPIAPAHATRALHAAALYLCHADPEADRRHYEFRVRNQAFQHTVVFSGDWDRPVLPVPLLPQHSWGPRQPELPPRFSCAELDRTASTIFGSSTTP